MNPIVLKLIGIRLSMLFKNCYGKNISAGPELREVCTSFNGKRSICISYFKFMNEFFPVKRFLVEG